MMKKDNTMVNLDVKGNLAKLIATENIIVQHNKVETASFALRLGSSNYHDANTFKDNHL